MKQYTMMKCNGVFLAAKKQIHTLNELLEGYYEPYFINRDHAMKRKIQLDIKIEKQ